MLCDYCKRRCNRVVPIVGFYCNDYYAPTISFSVGDMVWGRLYAYDTNTGKVVPNPQEFRIISLDEDIIRCYSDTSGIAHSFESSEYGEHFFLTEKELLSVYEFDNELR